MYKIDEILSSIIEKLQRIDPLCKNVKMGMTSGDNIVLDLSSVSTKIRLRCIEKVFRYLVAAFYPKGKLPILSEDKGRWLVVKLLSVSDITTDGDIVLRSIIRAIINRALYKGIILNNDILEELKKLHHVYKSISADKIVLNRSLNNFTKLCERIGICKGYEDRIVIDRRTIEWFSE